MPLYMDWDDYGRLVATSRFGAYTVSHGTAVAELRRQCGFDLALFQICNHYLLNFSDYDQLHASSKEVRDTVFVGLFGIDMDAPSSVTSSMESDETLLTMPWHSSS